MTLSFYKYQGTGNDFVLIDNRQLYFPKNDTKLVASLCDRKFGIGADGLILLENDELSDFKMVYYNADGREGSLCGNGGRCTVAFANFLGVIDKDTVFNAADGKHQATIANGIVSLQMQDVSEIKEKPEYVFLDTGSPHHVQMVKSVQDFEVYKEGKKLRYGMYGQTGSNVNFVETLDNDAFAVRTYERGVEDETLSCGTGVTAVAIAMHNAGKTSANRIKVNTQGGELEVEFAKKDGVYEQIHLIGPAKQVFKGEIEC
ncbi:diaminopimelate epimerase [Zobellia sp. 1_MG-2023]|uniref:diaminopimelate epimerase n=1 Tax=Zobellia sp. 1_MG-2023 TaxID=3062626 RepID=UPI0025983905|nr:diaminopimelate epimerase [Zobellia sp. 1_MG-2023]MDO6819273.1 diaminopimelate epimerase [Zobellia sp. 1_MG-2023]